MKRINISMEQIRVGITDDDVVEQWDFEDSSRIAKRFRNAYIGRAGRYVATRMVVLCGEPSYVECSGIFRSGFTLRVGQIAAHS